MSQQNSPRDSISDSSGSSPNAVYMLRSDKETSDLILFGQLVAKHQRSATVRRASSASLRNKQDSFAKSQDDLTVPVNPPPERGYRRSLDSTYRQSLESISEYKPKNFVSSTSLGPTPYRDNLESTCSDCTDYATRSATVERDGMHDNRTFQSPSSASYLSWIESVNAATISATSATPTKLPNSANSTLDEKNMDVDSKVGEWNNFWLNYNNPHTRYMTSPHVGNSTTCDDRTGDDVSDCKSTCSTQREFNEKLAGEQVVLTFDEVQEALNCAQRVVDILQKAIKRSDNDVELFIERGRHDSYYSTHTVSILGCLS